MKIAHLADLHLGYRSYYRVDENGINIRESDVMEAFREALRKIAKLQPDLIIIAGDVFHRPRPSNLTIYRTIHYLNLFRKQCSAPIIIISGNHEAVKSFESGNVLNIIETTVSNVAVVDGQIKELELKELDTLFVGVPYNALPELKNKNLVPDRNYKYNIMSVHGSYDSVKCPELSKYGHEELIKGENLNQKEWDYIAFGHYHSFTELEPNTFYSGSIERASTNVWKEAKEQKGFIDYDLDNKKCTFHALETPRKVYDLAPIDADKLTGPELSEKINELVSGISDIEKSIVRITALNVDHIAYKEIDYKKIREYKKRAVHFRLNLVKKDMNSQYTADGQLIDKKKTMAEHLHDELKEFELSQGISKEKFEAMAKQYLFNEVAI